MAISPWVAQPECDQGSARTKAWPARVKAKGFKLGPPRCSVDVAVARSMKLDGKTWRKVAKALGVSRATLLRPVALKTKAELAAGKEGT
ncbi:MAG: hypothetical protein QM820_04470 [Minicystis sp.]